MTTMQTQGLASRLVQQSHKNNDEYVIFNLLMILFHCGVSERSRVFRAWHISLKYWLKSSGYSAESSECSIWGQGPRAGHVLYGSLRSLSISGARFARRLGGGSLRSLLGARSLRSCARDTLFFFDTLKSSKDSSHCLSAHDTHTHYPVAGWTPPMCRDQDSTLFTLEPKQEKHGKVPI